MIKCDCFVVLILFSLAGTVAASLYLYLKRTDDIGITGDLSNCSISLPGMIVVSYISEKKPPVQVTTAKKSSIDRFGEAPSGVIGPDMH